MNKLLEIGTGQVSSYSIEELKKVLNVIKSIIKGESVIDFKSLNIPIETEEDAKKFLLGYQLNIEDNEMITSIQTEAISFINNNLVLDGDPSVPDEFLPDNTNLYQLIIIVASKPRNNKERIRKLWACAILKVMHVIYHIYDDIRLKHLPFIRSQIFSNIERHIHYKGDSILLGDKNPISLFRYETKEEKSRDGIILKLLHKTEGKITNINDIIGVRFVTYNKIDTLRVIDYLIRSRVIAWANAMPGESKNTLIDIDTLSYVLNEGNEEQIKNYIELIENNTIKFDKTDETNPYSINYHAIHLVARQKIIIPNTIYQLLDSLRNKIIGLRNSVNGENFTQFDSYVDSIESQLKQLNKNIEFYFPYEIQITDKNSYLENINTHEKYKNNKLCATRIRVLSDL